MGRCDPFGKSVERRTYLCGREWRRTAISPSDRFGKLARELPYYFNQFGDGAAGAGGLAGANEMALRLAAGDARILGYSNGGQQLRGPGHQPDIYSYTGAAELIKRALMVIFFGGCLVAAGLALSPSNNVTIFLPRNSSPTPFMPTRCSTTPTGSDPIFNPNDPARSGYELVLDSEFNDFNDFDFSCPSPPSQTGCINPQGKNWYLESWTIPNTVTNPATDLAISNGILSIHQSSQNGNEAISTMAPSGGASHGPAAWQQNWNGAVFTGGWYVEARIADQYIDNTTGQVVTAPVSHGHAAFWANATDHFNNSNPGGLWPGQGANYIHFVEVDMLDGIQGGNFYQTNLIDWYDGNTSVNAVGTGMNAFNQVGVSPNNAFDNNTFHIFAQLWVPATSTTQGYLQNYFDGAPTSKFTWNLYNPATPPPPSGQNIANIIDQDHMQIILGADPPNNGDTATVTEFVDWVHAWQLPTAATASGNTAITPQANYTGGNGSCA